MADVLTPTRLEPELIVLQGPSPATGFKQLRGRVLVHLASDLGAELVPIFERRGLQPARSHQKGQGVGLPPFFRVIAPIDQLQAIRERLSTAVDVIAAYIKPPAVPTIINAMAPIGPPAAPASPDLSARQLYLGPAPEGIAAEAAWLLPGGRGNTIKIADVEGGWHFDHEALSGTLTPLGGGFSSDADWIEHGTAVVACCLAPHSGSGVRGIAPEAKGIVVSALDSGGTAGAIRVAADALEPGDILVIELQRAGPRYGYLAPGGHGFIPIEWWPDDLAVVQYAVARGLIVVAAGGNGAENLDDAIYAAGDPGFPPTWQNPFGSVDSGAVLVGAGAPPPGTHGNDWGPDRSRLDFSNYGSRIDVQGWGREVTTAGYGDLQGGLDPNRWYTDGFRGTSSATPIVAGAVACLQGIAHAQGTRRGSAEIRDLLRTTGSPQAASPGGVEHVGPRPDLAALVAAL